jgi:hypothetical protein
MWAARQLIQLVTEKADLIQLAVLDGLVGRDVPDLGFGMGSDDGGQVVDEITLIDDAAATSLPWYGLNGAEPARQRGQDAVGVPGVTLDDQGADGITVDAISVCVRRRRQHLQHPAQLDLQVRPTHSEGQRSQGVGGRHDRRLI